MVVVKVYAMFPTEQFTNFKLKGFRGASRIVEDFTLVDLPCMNPNDWISLFPILSKDEVKYEPIVSHLKRMIVCYIHEVAKIDVEIAVVLKKRLVVDPIEETKDFQKRRLGKIKKKDQSVVYQRRSGDKVQKSLLFLFDKHLYSTTVLNHIMDLTVACKLNDVGELKGFGDMIKWYIVIRNTILNLMTRLYKVQNVEQ